VRLSTSKWTASSDSRRSRGSCAATRSRGLDRDAGVTGDEHDAPVCTRFDHGSGADADRRVDRLRAGVEQIERPDVDGATGQIDSAWARTFRCARDIIGPGRDL
jgi:hypothetical protein